MRRRYATSMEAADDQEYDVVKPAAGEKGRRGGPRSKLVEAIAVLLLAKPMRAAEIAEVLGYNSRYISSYLSYWKTRGLFDYENGFWVLTEEGEDFAKSVAEREMNSRVSQYAALAQSILSRAASSGEQVRETINGKKKRAGRRQSSGVLPFIASTTRTGGNKRQRSVARSCTKAILAELDELSEDENTVLEALLDHYTKWGSTYTYIDHLEKQLDADRVWLMNVLRMLQSKKLVYIYTDRRLGIRVGLSKRLREVLEACR